MSWWAEPTGKELSTSTSSSNLKRLCPSKSQPNLKPIKSKRSMLKYLNTRLSRSRRLSPGLTNKSLKHVLSFWRMSLEKCPMMMAMISFRQLRNLWAQLKMTLKQSCKAQPVLTSLSLRNVTKRQSTPCQWKSILTRPPSLLSFRLSTFSSEKYHLKTIVYN